MVIGRYNSFWMGVFLASVILCTLSRGLSVESKIVPQLVEGKEETLSQPALPTNNTTQSVASTTASHNVTASAADTGQSIESAANANGLIDLDNSLPQNEDTDDTSKNNDDISEENDDTSADNNVPEVTNTENESVNEDQNEVKPMNHTSKQNDTQNELHDNVKVDPQDDENPDLKHNLPTGETITTDSGEENLSTKTPDEDKVDDNVDRNKDADEDVDSEQVIEKVDADDEGNTADEKSVENEGVGPDKQPTVDDKERIHEQHTEINEYIFVHTGDTAIENDGSNFSFLRLFLVATVFFILFYLGYYHKHRIIKHFSVDSSEIYYHPLRTMQHNAVD